METGFVRPCHVKEVSFQRKLSQQRVGPNYCFENIYCPSKKKKRKKKRIFIGKI
jgi:hypothetical protein